MAAFVLDVIATGLKEGLDRWCKPDVIPKSVPVLQEDTVSSSVLRTMSMHKGAKAVNPQALESTRRARIQAKAAQSSEAVLKGPRADPFISRGVNPGGVVKNRELPPIPTLSLPDNTKTRRVDADNATSKNSGRISMSPSVDSSPTEGDWSIRQLSARLSGRQNSGKSKSWFDEWINTDENHASKMNDKKAKEEISAPLESNEMMNAASPNRVRSNSREKQSISRSSSFSISSKLKILRQRISKNPSNNLSEQSMESKLSDSSLINEHSSSGSVIDAINEEGQFLHDGIGDMKGRRGSDSAKLAHFKTDASLNGVPHSSIQVDSSANQAVDVYHVVMSVVAGLQEEYAVPIVVYNL